ncbi:glycosyltransferase [Hymenobacter sp. BT683]|uniref:Glycosyltransferase n=1 Tax=Hymenobacter jeongseonensis TaxID=2791027 RepID=A0ABS0IKE6_9BACT|nr:glycosyltransferase [Hymenobacter jeongseonensis]MBF9238845.1 glycosyltransferase [Hymenobacter jeongseonensis]
MLGSGSSQLVVLLASVLKPVDDTRMHEKFAQTLLSRPNTQVHVVGRAPGNALDRNLPKEFFRLHQHSIFEGSRLSLKRLMAQWRYWRLLKALRPDIVIVHAPELLPLTVLWQKMSIGRKFLYDIRENYALNISTQRVYGGITQRWLAAGLRWVEGWAAAQAAGLILAEASYADELPFLAKLDPNRVVVIENKYQPDPGESAATQALQLPYTVRPIRVLYSGTISELNGVWEAIAFTEQLHWAWPGGAHLTIVGFCQQPNLLRRLQEKVAAHPAWLTLVGGAEPVPHARIVAEINRSHLGLLPYRPHPSTERCRPTKLFEYLAHGLPLISSPNALWQALLSKHGAGWQLDFTQPLDRTAVVARLQTSNFYPLGVPTEVLWTEEGKKLWLLLDSLV